MGTTGSPGDGVIPAEWSSERCVPHALRYAAARGLIVGAARKGWLGDLAAEVGQSDLLEEVCDREDEVRLAIFRAWHAGRVAAASPVALDLLASQGGAADAFASLLRPEDWSRRWISGRLVNRTRSPASYVPRGSSALAVEARWTFLHGGVVLRPWGDPAGALGLRLSTAGLEIGARLASGAHVRTCEGRVSVTVDAAVPCSIRVAAVGRRVDDLFDHDLVNGKGYIVERSEDYRRGADAGGRLPWRVWFRAPPVRWRVPWAGRGR